MGVNCSQCQKNENEYQTNYTPSKKEIPKPTQVNICIKQSRDNFNKIFNSKLPLFGEYYKEDFIKLIPEKIRNQITENVFDLSHYQISNKNTYEVPPIIFKNGNIYKGNWNKNGEMDGEGVYILKNDNVIVEGVWDKGELKGGRIFFPNGEIYEGEIQNSVFNGKGKLKSNNGIIFEGDFVNGEKIGNVKIIYPDGSYYKGEYNNNNYNGKGEFHWKNGYTYKGNFLNGKLEGKGILKNEISGSEYNGNFSNNNFEGEGIYKWNNGNYYNGNYHINKKNGEGIYKEKNGICYNGNWVNGQPHGIGKFDNGEKIYKCSWRNGEPIEIPSIDNIEVHSSKMSFSDIKKLYFVPDEEDIETDLLNYLEFDYKEGDFKPNETFSSSFH